MKAKGLVDDYQELISSNIGQANIIPVPVEFVRWLGDYPAAALLTQLLYWQERTTNKYGWVFKTYAELGEELFITEFQIRDRAKRLESMGIIEIDTRKAYGIPTKHYRINAENFKDSFLKFLKERKLNILSNESLKSEESLTETTTEITTETTTDLVCVAAPLHNTHSTISNFAIKDDKVEENVVKPSGDEVVALNGTKPTNELIFIPDDFTIPEYVFDIAQEKNQHVDVRKEFRRFKAYYQEKKQLNDNRGKRFNWKGQFGGWLRNAKPDYAYLTAQRNEQNNQRKAKQDNSDSIRVEKYVWTPERIEEQKKLMRERMAMRGKKEPPDIV